VNEIGAEIFVALAMGQDVFFRSAQHRNSEANAVVIPSNYFNWRYRVFTNLGPEAWFVGGDRPFAREF
jgi:hypothetical protein